MKKLVNWWRNLYHTHKKTGIILLITIVLIGVSFFFKYPLKQILQGGISILIIIIGIHLAGCFPKINEKKIIIVTVCAVIGIIILIEIELLPILWEAYNL